jgi:excisionase family DNA binding protein
MNMTSETLAFTVSKAAAATGTSRARLYEAMRSGQLRACKFGRRTLIPTDELKRWLGSLPDARSNTQS